MSERHKLSFNTNSAASYQGNRQKPKYDRVTNAPNHRRWKYFRGRCIYTHTQPPCPRIDTHRWENVHALAHWYWLLKCGSLGLALSRACGNSPAVPTLPHTKYIYLLNSRTMSRQHNKCIKIFYLHENSTIASVPFLLERWIEVVGPGGLGVGEKNRSEEAYFILRRTVMRNRDSRAHYFARS